MTIVLSAPHTSGIKRCYFNNMMHSTSQEGKGREKEHRLEALSLKEKGLSLAISPGQEFEEAIFFSFMKCFCPVIFWSK
jgi:hypothetical protein